MRGRNAFIVTHLTICVSAYKLLLLRFQQHLTLWSLFSWILLYRWLSFTCSEWSRGGSLHSGGSSQSRAVSSGHLPAGMKEIYKEYEVLLHWTSTVEITEVLRSYLIEGVILYSFDVHSRVWSVREEDCVTRQACPSHQYVSVDTTVLQRPLFLAPVLQSVSVY